MDFYEIKMSFINISEIVIHQKKNKNCLVESGKLTFARKVFPFPKKTNRVSPDGKSALIKTKCSFYLKHNNGLSHFYP